MKKKIQLTLKNTKFHDSTVVSACACSEITDLSSNGITSLVDVLIKSAFVPKRDISGNFLFSVDHCFPIKGQGTVITGTVLQGKVSNNDVGISSVVLFFKQTYKICSLV